MTDQPEIKAVYVRLPVDMAERIQQLADANLRTLPSQIIFMLRRDLATSEQATKAGGGDT